MPNKSFAHISLADELGPFLFKQGVNQLETDLTVWKAFKHGNRKAFDYIFEKYSRLLYAYGMRLTRNAAVVEDCIQDLFVELWNKRGNLGDTTSIRFYLMKSLRRRIVKMISKEIQNATAAQNVVSDEEYIDFSCEFIMIEQESDLLRRQKLQQAVDQLTKRQKEAIYLRYYEQMTYESIAAVMNLTIESTYALIGKAINALRQSYS